MTKCVHTEHCSAHWGCKYGEFDCPVWLGYKCQSFITEMDADNGCESLADLPSISIKEFKNRRDVVAELRKSWPKQ